MVSDKRIFLTKVVFVSGRTPKDIFAFLLNLDKDKYIQWHPQDHRDYRLVKETPERLGSVFYFDEVIGGRFRINYEWTLMELEENQKLLMKAKYFIPIALLLTFKEQGNGTLVTHQLQVGYSRYKWINAVIRMLGFRKVIVKALNKHTEEEFKNLEKLIR